MLFDPRLLRFVASGHLDRLADLAPSGEIPPIGEILALLGFHRLDRTVVPFEEKTGAIFLVDQGEAASVGTQPGVVLDKMILFHSEMLRDSADLFGSHPDKSRPAAAGGTALAEIGRRHKKIS